MNWGKQNIMGWIVCPPNSYVEALTLRANPYVEIGLLKIKLKRGITLCPNPV